MLTVVRPDQDHCESIFNFQPDCTGPPPLYESRYKEKIREEYALTKTGCWQTMGLPDIGPESPKCFLRKYSGLLQKYQSSLLYNSSNYCTCPQCFRKLEKDRLQTFFPTCQIIHEEEECENNCNLCMGGGDADEAAGEPEEYMSSYADFDQGGGDCSPPYIPTKMSFNNGEVFLIDRGQKDFIRENALSVLQAPPCLPQPQLVDDHKGHRAKLLENPLLSSKTFGKVPNYIYKRKRELCEAEWECKRALQKEKDRKCRLVSWEEKAWIVKGLKRQWSLAFDEFQSFPLSTSSPKLIKMKEEVEDTLKKLEKKIKFFSKIGPLYVGEEPDCGSSKKSSHTQTQNCCPKKKKSPFCKIYSNKDYSTLRC